MEYEVISDTGILNGMNANSLASFVKNITGIHFAEPGMYIIRLVDEDIPYDRPHSKFEFDNRVIYRYDFEGAEEGDICDIHVTRNKTTLSEKGVMELLLLHRIIKFNGLAPLSQDYQLA